MTNQILSDNDVKSIAKAVAALTKPLDPTATWGYAEIGKMAGKTESTGRRIAKNPTFPSAKQIPTDVEGGKHINRYLAKDVIAWFERNPSSRA